MNTCPKGEMSRSRNPEIEGPRDFETRERRQSEYQVTYTPWHSHLQLLAMFIDLATL